mgnify:CR=1 FL=1
MTVSQSGYRRYYDALKKYLSAELGDSIAMEAVADRGITGNFEVTVDGHLVHSKKNGQGRAETRQEKKMILEQIQEILEEQ